jgi:CHAT domain-containing protein
MSPCVTRKPGVTLINLATDSAHRLDLSSLSAWETTRFLRTLFATLFVLVAADNAIASRSPETKRSWTSVVAVSQVRTLVPGELLQRHMDAGATHVYELTLAAQQFAEIVVEQKGIDVEVRAFSPDGTLYVLTDNPNGFYGRETVSIAAQISGAYRIEISSDKAYPAGDYELKVEGPRPASASDERRVTAERIFAEAQKFRRDAAEKLSKDEAVETYNLAITKYNEALTIWRELGNLRGQGYALTNTGRVYKILRQPSLAFEHLAQALSCLREADDTSGQAFVLNETGAVHRDFGNVRDALTSYDEALKLRLQLGDRYGQAQLYNNLGLGYSNIGYQPQAVTNLEKASHIWAELGLRDSEMNTLINAAKAHVEMGDVVVALSQYQTVLAYCDAELSNENSSLQKSANFLKPFALDGIGLVYDTWADSGTASDYYKKALELFRARRIKQGDVNQGEADALDNLGMLHAFLGDAAQARDYFREALAIREQLKQPKPWGMTLSNLGYAYTLLGDNEEALKQLTLALAHSRNSSDRRFEAYTLIRIGMAYVALNQPSKALEHYEQALNIQQDPQFEDRRGLAITLDKMGEALALSAQWTEALSRYEQALESWTAVGDEQGRALSLYGFARVERARHNLANARDRAEEAVSIIEKLRNRMTARQLQMTYFGGKQDLYALAIDVRVQLSELATSPTDRATHVEAALSTSEQARARNLLDLLSETRAEPHQGMSPQEVEKNNRLQRQISELTQALFRFRSFGSKESAATAEGMLAAQMKEQDELLASARRASRNANQTRTAQPLAAQEIQKLLDDNTLLLHYSLGEDRGHLWAVTRSAIDHHFLPGRTEVEDAAWEFRKGLTANEPQRDEETRDQYLRRWREAPDQRRGGAVKLSRMLLGPVLGQLGNKRLVIVADGGLQYIPFEALPVPESDLAADRAELTTLLQNNEIVYEPSASTIALLRRAQRSRTSKTVAVIADPVYTKDPARTSTALALEDAGSPARVLPERLTRSLRDIGDNGKSLTLPRLEYSLREANAITSIAPRGSWMKAVGYKASRATVTSPILKQFNIVHFATHGIFNDKNPELSGIVLSLVNELGQSQDGFLTLRDIYDLDLPVHLVVLSACQTGMGRPVRGEGLIGLTRGFMYAGARSVVVSLWRVNDQATAELMKRFYKHMLGKDKLPAAAALRQAQLEMQADKVWHDPYYWAGFILQGDWK